MLFLKAQVMRDVDLLANKPALLRAIIDSPDSPDEVLADYAKVHHGALQDSLFEVEGRTETKKVAKSRSKSA